MRHSDHSNAKVMYYLENYYYPGYIKKNSENFVTEFIK